MWNIKKLIIICAILILCTFLFVGCVKVSGSYSVRNNKMNLTNHSFGMDYTEFNGTKRFTTDFDKSDKVNIKYETEAGVLTLEIKCGDTIIYSETIETGEFVLDIPEDEDYTFTFIGKDHNGMFFVSW